MSAPVLEAKGLGIRFGGVVAAADVTVRVDEREVVGIIGANGAGKTTFVNMVTGYLKPQTGRIRYLGRDVTPLSPREITRIGIRRSFQIPQVFDEMTALDNLLAALALAPSARRSWWRPLRRPETVEAARRVLERFAIGAFADHEAGLLPQGVRKILDIAMATVEEPRLVLLDEPTSGVSADEKFPVMDTLMGALAEQGVTTLFVEHDMEVVERYAQRVLAFYSGEVIADGSVEAVLADPDVRRYVVGKELHRGSRAERGP
ncbi:MAG: ABC transporter ATP-binding protein [Deferrisomatales bacterium]